MSQKPLCNIAQTLKDATALNPDKPAVVHAVGRKAGGGARYESISFRQLDDESDRIAAGLINSGFRRGSRTILMVRPGLNFVSVTFALFKCGVVPVFIDPGMGIKNLLGCVKQVGCDGFIGVPAAQLLRIAYRKNFKSIKNIVTVGRKIFWGGHTLEEIVKSGGSHEMAATEAEDTAAIIFTTGSTGPPKGVVFTHGTFTAQVELIRKRYGITPHDVDLSAFPLFALFAAGMGMTAVIPDMNPTKPAKVNPARIVEAVNDQKVTFTFGSPSIWNRVSSHCVENDIKLPTLKRVLMAGAPVAVEIHERLLGSIMPEGGSTHTPYGATEALPISDMAGAEVLNETGAETAKGKGICVGRVLEGIDIKIIKITEEAVPEWDGSLELPQGATGEIVVKGPVVNSEYFGLPEINRLSKIKEGSEIWHRMGDAGYFDAKGRLWFCGRKGHRVVTESGTLYTVCCEAIFNRHPQVVRTALVGLGAWPNQRPVIIAELIRGGQAKNRAKITEELLEIAAGNELTNSIREVLFHREFPTDIRHNAKIFREKLKTWAEKKLPHLIPN